MLLSLLQAKRFRPPSIVRRLYRQRSGANSVERQRVDLDLVKREKWTEADVDALPPGEHDYFERKSGQLFLNTGDLMGKLAKTLSALANSGGGHIILGVDDSGVPDGVAPSQGSTSIRDWLEQKIPHLVEYPLADFRVHLVEPASTSRIPAGRQVIVVDVGDSALAPHQCAHGGSDARKYCYYYRQAGRSEPAPHFYLELLRQRLVAPSIEANLIEVTPVKSRAVDDGVFLAMRFRFVLKNTGRVAAYKWQLQVTEMDGHPASRFRDYRFSVGDYPPGFGSSSGGIRIDDTILPGCFMREDKDLGILLRASRAVDQEVRTEIDTLLVAVALGVRVATEVSPGVLQRVHLRDLVDVDQLVSFILGSSTEPA